MALFLSTFINKIDKKGRVSVPAPFRVALSEQSFQGFIAFRSYKHQAIEACRLDRMNKLSQSVDQLDLFSEDQDDFAATIFADAQQISMDGEGRIMLPKTLLDHSHISDAVAFVGRGATFQLWQPALFQAHQEQARLRIQKKQTILRLKSQGDDV